MAAMAGCSALGCGAAGVAAGPLQTVRGGGCPAAASGRVRVEREFGRLSQKLDARAGRKTARRSFFCSASFQPNSGVLTPELKEAIEKYVTTNKIVLFMKGNKMFPQCGFSNTCVQILNTLEVPYETVNILENEQLRQGMKEYSSWPTFPQLYIDGEFFGGCDIAIEAFQSGELKELAEKALLS